MELDTRYEDVHRAVCFVVVIKNDTGQHYVKYTIGISVL
jgi:hypothetical protein